MLEPGVVRFGLGPLTEVVAQHHRFDELAPHLDSSLVAVVAQERVLRGEDLRDDERALAAIADSGADVPAVLQAFEPDYALPTYRADTRLDGTFLLADAGWSDIGVPAPPDVAGPVRASSVPADDRAARVRDALHACVEPWLSGSDGVVELAAVRGTAADVIAQLARALEAASDGAVADADADAARPIMRRELTSGELLGLVAFAAASGGARGRRRGGAAGRASAWWLARVATGLDADAWSEDLPDELEFRLEDLELQALRSPRPASWRLEVLIADPADGWSAGISALDLADTGEVDMQHGGVEEAQHG
jgi:hypothetical protein